MRLPSAIRLKMDFNPERLLADLNAAKAGFRSAPQRGPYHDGTWTGISLRALNGDYKNTLAMSFSNVEDTEVLDHCPYFKEILDSLPFPVGVTRILFLPPGKKIHSHRDQGFGWEKGHVRLHIPIVTDPKVDFQIGEESVHWPVGQFWFGDFNQPHQLHNRSDIVRVHLVMDCFLTTGLLSLMPEHELDVVGLLTSIKTFDDWNSLGSITNPALFCGYFRVPSTIIKLPLYGKIDGTENTLEMRLLGLPFSFRFRPVAEDRFQGLGNELDFHRSAQGTTFSLREMNTQKEHQAQLVKSLPWVARLHSMLQIALVRSLFEISQILVKGKQWAKRLVNPA